MSDVATVPRTGRPARARSLSCPNCGAPVTVRASGISVSAVCSSCGSVLDVSNPDVQMLAAAQARTQQPPIPIGTRGVLQGTEWEVIGFQTRSSGEGSWSWDEYLLYNPYQGFRFLAQDHGTWTLYVLLRTSVSEDGQVSGDPRRYTPDEPVTARTDYVLGEFYWRVKLGDTVSVREFTSEPFVLSQERNGTEVTWSRGEHLPEPVVRAAFRLPEPPNRRSVWSYWGVASVSIVLMVLLQSIGFGQYRNLLLTRQSFTVTAGEPRHAQASPVFTVPDRGGNLTFMVTADPVRIMTMELSLVDAAGTQRFDGTIATDGYGNPADYSFAAIPGGQYKLLATLPSSAEDGAPDDMVPSETITVDVRRHTPSMAFFWLFAIAILIWPCVVSFRRVR